MVKLNELRPNEGSTKREKRLGRGQGSGQGCTAGRGSNGSYSRSGYSHRAYFEGGQTPLSRRIPKKGFNNPFRVEFQIVNVGDLEKIETDGTEIDTKWLFEHGLVHSEDKPVKVLGHGDLTKKVSVKADTFSKSAREKIEKAKGKVEVI